jgi:hypothetical protein
VVAILRPARTPKGTEVRTVIKHVTKRMKKQWPKTRIIWRGDSHYGRVEAMDWADDNDTDYYIFGLAGNAVLDALVAEVADNLRFRHALSRKEKLRTFTRPAAGSGRARWWPGWSVRCSRTPGRPPRPACARRSTSAMSSPRLKARRSTFTGTSTASAGQLAHQHRGD